MDELNHSSISDCVYHAKYYATAVFFWRPFCKMAAKAHIDSISIGPIAINLLRDIVYYLNELNHSVIIDCASLCKILCDCSVLFAAILKKNGHFEKMAAKTHIDSISTGPIAINVAGHIVYTC